MWLFFFMQNETQHNATEPYRTEHTITDLTEPNTTQLNPTLHNITALTQLNSTKPNGTQRYSTQPP